MSLVCFKARGHLNSGFTYHHHHTSNHTGVEWQYLVNILLIFQGPMLRVSSRGSVYSCSFHYCMVLQNLSFQEGAKNRFTPVSIPSHLLSVILLGPCKGDQLSLLLEMIRQMFQLTLPVAEDDLRLKVAFKQSVHFLSSRKPARCECVVSWPGSPSHPLCPPEEEWPASFFLDFII